MEVLSWGNRRLVVTRLEKDIMCWYHHDPICSFCCNLISTWV